MANTKRVGLPVGAGLTAQTGERGQAPAYDEAFRMSLLKFDLHRDPVLLKAQLGNLGSVTTKRIALRRVVAQQSEQQHARFFPIAFHRSHGNIKRGGDFVFGEAAEEAHLHDLH